MDPQAVRGGTVALQIRSAIAQQNVITLGNMLRRRPSLENICQIKVNFCEFLESFHLCLVSVPFLRKVCSFYYIWFIIL